MFRIQNLLILLAIGSIAYIYTHYIYELRPFAARIQNPAPQYSFTDLNGKNRYSKDFEGKYVIINFWATWCAPCVQEFPRLIELAERNPKRYVVIALSSDQDNKTIEKFLKMQHNAPRSQNMIVARDAGKITGPLFKTYKLPETIIIDPRQQLRKKIIGASWTVEDIEKAISRM